MAQRPIAENTSLDPTTLLLRRALWKALRLTVVPAALGASGCGNAISVEGFAKVSCDPIQDLMPSEDVDYVSLRYAEDSGSPARRVTVLSEVGEPCKKAHDSAACLAALDAPEGLIDNNIGVDHGVTLYVATTRGDQVKNYDTPEKLATWLGEIDTPDEAVLVASLLAYDFDCKKKENGAVKETSDGFSLVGTKLTDSCPVKTSRFLLAVSRDASVNVEDREKIESDSNACIGRRPAGLRERPAAERSVGELFGQVAHLEAASVHAFRQLARALTVYGAPASLVCQARQAARDEIRHARETRRIAARFGGRYVSPVIDVKPLPGLAELALDNAIEGCVRETFGALFGMFQATQAEDLDIRRTMARIAADETRHASLALQVAEWIAPLLSAEERAALERAQQRALIELEQELSETQDDATLREVAGVPTAAEATRLLASLRSQLWQPSRAA